MDKKPREVRESQKFRDDLKEYAEFIAISSIEKAIEFLEGVVNILELIIQNPLAYQECEFIPTKNKLYRRAFYKKQYRIVYKVTSKYIKILAILHTSRSPSKIKTLRAK